MALKQYHDENLRVITQESSKNRVQEIAKKHNFLYCYVNNEPENDYNIPLSNRDWDLVMQSIEKPECNQTLANTINRKLVFEE